MIIIYVNMAEIYYSTYYNRWVLRVRILLPGNANPSEIRWKLFSTEYEAKSLYYAEYTYLPLSS